MRKEGYLTGVAVLLLVGGAMGADAWHHPLYLDGGGCWRRRVRVEVRSDMDADAAGEPVAVRIGRGAGEADLVAAAAGAVRVCDANGVEMLYAITSPGGEPIVRGPIPAGSVLTIPAECRAGQAAAYYVYFDNPAAWRVPDFLPAASVGIRNGDLEGGAGDVPAGWRHDAQDPGHRVSWTAENARSGKRSLKTAVADGAEPTWIATRQHGISMRGGAKYAMSAWVRARNVKGQAGWYIHVGSAAKEMMISPMLLGGGGTYDWKQVTVTFTAPAGATRASVGTVLRGTGTAWFDDAALTCLTPGRLRAVAGKIERLRLTEAGSTDPWPGGEDGEVLGRRVPVKVFNFPNRPIPAALIAVQTASLEAALGRELDPMRVLVRSGGRPLPNHLMVDLLLFEAAVPGRAAQTSHVYWRTREPARAEDVRNYRQMLRSPANVVRNPSFERGEKLPADWPGNAEGARPAGTAMSLVEGGSFGKRCVRLHVPHGSRPAWTGWRQDVPVRPGRTYVFAAWVKCRDIRNGSVQLHGHYRNAAGQLCREKRYASAGPALTGTSDWTLLDGTFTMPDDAATFQLHLTMNATGTVWHDGVLLAEILPAAVGRAEHRTAAPETAPAVWCVNAIVKVFQDDVPPAKPSPARLTAARNEAEPLQLAVRCGRGLKQLAVEIDPPADGRGNKLTDLTAGVVGYVPIDHKTSYYRSTSPAWRRKFPTAAGRCDGWAGMWPDPILPRKTFDLAPGKTQPIWITVTVPKDAAAGDYAGAVRLVRSGKTLKRIPLAVHVWDFALPDRTHLAAVYDVRMHSPLWRRPGQTQDAARRRMWRFLARRRLCPDRIHPEPVLRYGDGKVHADFARYDEAAAYYFDALKLPHTYTPRCFYLFGWGHPPRTCFGQRPYEGDPPYEAADRSRLRPAFKTAYQACLKAYWEHMKAKGWHKKVLLYISDEPHDRYEHIREQMKALCEMIHEVDREIPIYSSTWHHQPAWDASLDVWGIGHYGVVPVAKMADLRAAGKRLWFTTDGQMCTDTPYCAVERLLPHYCFHCGAEAYEFWGVDWLTYDPYEFGWHRYIHQSDRPGSSYYVRYPNGDGYLAYPGRPVGSDGPVPSIRLEQAREGAEDYEYLRLLRGLVAKAKSAGRDASAGEAALRAAGKLVAIPNAGGRYSTRILPDPDAVFRVREQVAPAIEKLRR